MTDAEIMALLDDVIKTAAKRITSPQPGDDLSDIGELSEGLTGLLTLKRMSRPRSPDAIADELVGMGIKPHQFLHILRAAWARAA